MNNEIPGGRIQEKNKYALQTEMIKLIKENSLFVCIVTFFCIFIALKMVDESRNLSLLEAEIYRKNSKVLKHFIEAYRSVYQRAFVDNHISLDEGNMYLLPVMALSKISKEFTYVTGGRVTVNAVTDRPRNLNNKADNIEQKAIQFFRKDATKQEYFEKVSTGKDQFYFYASPFYIQKMCLQCHGSREEVLPDVAQKYSTAFDYKEGELRGVISIKMKKANIRNELISLFHKTTLVTLAVSILFLTVIFFLIRKLKMQDAQYTQELEKTVRNQTGELQEQVNLLREYSKVLDASLIVSKGDLEGNITYVNDKMSQVFGYGPSELIGRPHSFLQHSDMDDHVFLDLWKNIQNKKIWQGLLKNRKKDGSHCWAQTTVCPILDNTGEIVEYIAARADVTELVENRQEMQALLTTDNLTGLPNRYQMLMDLSGQDMTTVILFDIHAFADINDYFGIETGDCILVEFVRRLQQECEGKPCKLYKLPGDQSALLVKEKWSLPEVEATVEQLTDCITRRPFYVKESEIAVHVTCGISWNVEKNGLLEADIALKQAKKNRQEYVVNKESGSIMLELEKNHSIAVDIKNALHEGRVVTFFQPIIRAATGEIDKYECLVRIIDEDGTVIPPCRFLDASKKARIYTKITIAVIDRACAAFADSTMEFSVNLSTQDILDLSVVKHLKRKLGKSSIGERAILEIVETEGFENYDEVAEFIKEMKEMGCKIAIDDFGSGHSNYERLLKLQVDYLKIDGSILKKLTSDEISQTIVETIVAVAKKLGIETVAEFVYDKETAELATSLGVDFLQGYYFSEPLQSINEG